MQKVSKYAGRDPCLLKKTDFSTELKDLPAKSTRGVYFIVFTACSCLNVTSTKQRKKTKRYWVNRYRVGSRSIAAGLSIMCDTREDQRRRDWPIRKRIPFIVATLGERAII